MNIGVSRGFKEGIDHMNVHREGEDSHDHDLHANLQGLSSMKRTKSLYTKKSVSISVKENKNNK
jgi:hypothetical protein